MRKLIIHLAIILMLTCTLLLQGCATLGTPYQKVERTPDKKARVYIYRPSRFAAWAVHYDVYVGDRNKITTLYNGGYNSHLIKPGKVEIWAETETKSSVEFVAKAGKTYFVKGTIHMGLLVGRLHLELVPTDVAENEIKKCNLIPEKKQEQTDE